jgi:hypothetical protein
VLPIAGQVLVKVGDRVAARDVVAEAFMPGDVTPINLANQLSLPPGDVVSCVLKKEGDRVEVGEVLARTKGLFGMFQSEYRSKVAGTIETISAVTGQLIVRGEPQPVRVRAYLAGEVVEVLPREGVEIEAEATFVQGIFGIGGEAYGPIYLACADAQQELAAERITPEMQGAVVVGGGRVSSAALRRGVEVGVAAIVSGGIDDQDLKEFLGHDLGVAITGSEQVGLTLIITEGFGDIAMAERTWRLLQRRAGDEAAVNGATQIRAGVMRPEIVIPLSGREIEQKSPSAATSGYLEPGTPVRIIRDPHFGVIGRVRSLPPEPQVLASGSKARVLEVELDAGQCVIVPRANVELIEG